MNNNHSPLWNLSVLGIFFGLWPLIGWWNLLDYMSLAGPSNNFDDSNYLILNLFFNWSIPVTLSLFFYVIEPYPYIVFKKILEYCSYIYLIMSSFSFSMFYILYFSKSLTFFGITTTNNPIDEFFIYENVISEKPRFLFSPELFLFFLSLFLIFSTGLFTIALIKKTKNKKLSL